MWNTREIGTVGESIACKWLIKQGYFIVERNYLKKWGELDIVATKDNILHFIEVKSVQNVYSGYRPEDNVHDIKVRRLRRAIQTYLNEKRYDRDAEFKFHVLTILMNPVTRRARVNFLENIVL